MHNGGLVAVVSIGILLLFAVVGVFYISSRGWLLRTGEPTGEVTLDPLVPPREWCPRRTSGGSACYNVHIRPTATPSPGCEQELGVYEIFVDVGSSESFARSQAYARARQEADGVCEQSTCGEGATCPRPADLPATHECVLDEGYPPARRAQREGTQVRADCVRTGGPDTVDVHDRETSEYSQKDQWSFECRTWCEFCLRCKARRISTPSDTSPVPGSEEVF